MNCLFKNMIPRGFTNKRVVRDLICQKCHQDWTVIMGTFNTLPIPRYCPSCGKKMNCDDCKKLADIYLIKAKAQLCWECLKLRQTIVAAVAELGRGKPDGTLIPLSEITKIVKQRMGVNNEGI